MSFFYPLFFAAETHRSWGCGDFQNFVLFKNIELLSHILKIQLYKNDIYTPNGSVYQICHICVRSNGEHERGSSVKNRIFQKLDM